MRTLVAALFALFSCLAVLGQAAASTSAAYSDCCAQGCKGMAHCAAAGCQACAAPQAMPGPGLARPWADSGWTWCLAPTPFDAGLRREPWTPPD